MFLIDEEKKMQAGEYGLGIQRAISLLITLGDSFYAERLVPISYGHISYDFCPNNFWNFITEDVPATPHRVTTHPSYQPQTWKQWGLPLAEKWVDEHEKKVQTLTQLVANNSLFGARVDRMGILISMAAAICGRTPLMGLLLPENRYAIHKVVLDDLDVTDWTTSDFHCLGYCIGNKIPGFKPVAIHGLPHNLPFDFARALVISMPTSGAVTLAHLVGTTPEAATLEEALGNKKPKHVIRIGKRDMIQAWEKLNVWDDDIVEHVAFGCPHASIDEIARIAALLDGKIIKTSLLIGASAPVKSLARQQGYLDSIENAGGHIISVCPSISNPFTRGDIAGQKQAKSAATNSARGAHYLAAVSGVKVFFGTEEACINAAITGRWKGETLRWK